METARKIEMVQKLPDNFKDRFYIILQNFQNNQSNMEK